MTTIYPLEKEAYEIYTTGIGGVELKRFLSLESFERMSQALQRPLTDAERKLFVDFEWENGQEDHQAIMHTCACGAQFPGVWWRFPTDRYIQHLQETGELKPEDIEKFWLPTFGCHFLKKDDILAPHISLCGPAFPAYNQALEKYEHSHLRMQATKGEKLRGKQMKFGRPLNIILKEQAEEKRAREEDAEANRKAKEEHERRLAEIAARREAKEKAKKEAQEKRLREAAEKAAEELAKKRAEEEAWLEKSDAMFKSLPELD